MEKRESLYTMVGMYIGAAAMEHSMDIAQEIKNSTTIDRIPQSHLGVYQGNKTIILQLFTIPKV